MRIFRKNRLNEPFVCAFVMLPFLERGWRGGGERVSVQCEKQFGTRILREIPSLWEKIHL